MTTTSRSAAASPPPRSRPPSSSGAIIGVVLVAAFMDLLDVTIVAVAAPQIQDSLRASPSGLQWVVAAYTLALGAALVTGGRLGDAHGRRRVFLAGLVAFLISSALCGVAPSVAVLLAARVVQGLAAGCMVPQVFGIIRASLTPRQGAVALGAYGGVQGLASIAGPLLGGLLVTADVFGLGWRAIFFVNVPVGLIALLVAWRVLPESRRDGSASLDGWGALLLAVALVLVLLPIVQGRSWGWPWWGWALLALGSAVFTVFVRWEHRLEQHGGAPIFEPSLVRHRGFAAGLLASLVFFGGIASFFLLLSIYLQAGTGRTALATGLITLPYALGSMVTSGVGVQLAGRRGRSLLVGGSVVIAASHAAMWWVVALGADPSWWQLGLPLLLGGLGLGLAAPPLIDVVLAAAPARAAGSAGGVLSTVNQIGGSVGVAALGAVFFARAADGGGVDAMREAFVAVLPWQCGLYVVAAALMTLLPPGSDARPAAPDAPMPG